MKRFLDTGKPFGVVDLKNNLPGADSIFFNTVTTHQPFTDFNSLTERKKG